MKYKANPQIIHAYAFFERVWSRSHSAEDLRALHSASNRYHSAIIKAKKGLQLYYYLFWSNLILVNFGILGLVKKFLHRTAVSINLGFPGNLSGGYLWYWPCSAFSSHFDFVSGQLHIIHQRNSLFDFTTQLFKNVSRHQVAQLLNFYKHYQSAPFYIFVHCHLISYQFVI